MMRTHKTWTAVVTVVLILCICTVSLLSCDNVGGGGSTLSGTYASSAVGDSYTFSEDGTVVHKDILGSEYEGTYKIEGDEITFDFGSAPAVAFVNGTKDFTRKGSNIVIGSLTYNKK